MAPDLKRKVDATRTARQAREAEMKKQIDAQVNPLSSEQRFFIGHFASCVLILLNSPTIFLASRPDRV
jgi:hypothetical protein